MSDYFTVLSAGLHVQLGWWVMHCTSENHYLQWECSLTYFWKSWSVLYWNITKYHQIWYCWDLFRSHKCCEGLQNFVYWDMLQQRSLSVDLFSQLSLLMALLELTRYCCEEACSGPETQLLLEKVSRYWENVWDENSQKRKKNK